MVLLMAYFGKEFGEVKCPTGLVKWVTKRLLLVSLIERVINSS